MGTLPGSALFAPYTGQAEDAADDAALEPAVHAHEDVFERRHLLEQADVLERAPDAPLGHEVRRPVGDVLACELDDAGRHLVDAGDHVEERRLAGAVRPDEAYDRALGDREVDVVHGHEAAEFLAQRGRLEEQLGHQRCTSTSGSSCTPSSNSCFRRASGNSPYGRTSMTTTRMIP